MPRVDTSRLLFERALLLPTLMSLPGVAAVVFKRVDADAGNLMVSCQRVDEMGSLNSLLL